MPNDLITALQSPAVADLPGWARDTMREAAAALNNDTALVDAIVASLAGKRADGTPNAGLIGGMSQGTARRLVLEGIRAARQV